MAMHSYRFYIKVNSGNLGVFTQTWTSVVLIVIYCVVIDFLVSFRKAALSADSKLKAKIFRHRVMVLWSDFSSWIFPCDSLILDFVYSVKHILRHDFTQ